MNFKSGKLRQKAVKGFIICAFIILWSKLFTLQVLNKDKFSSFSVDQHISAISIWGKRGEIYDRNSVLLAFDIPGWSLYAQPLLLEEKDRIVVAKKISPILGIPSSEIFKRINVNKKFVWIKRKLPRELKEKIERLNIKGLGFIKEARRVYPQGNLASQVLGFVGVDNQGLEGLEFFYNDILKGQKGFVYLYKDGRKKKFFLPGKSIRGFEGSDIILTIDVYIQKVVEEELEHQCREFKARSGSCIVINPFTGEILAMANWPTFSPVHPQDFDPLSYRNRAISEVFEPGSIFKIITASLALERKLFDEDDKIFCENGKYKKFGRTLHDHRPHGMLTFRDVIVESSNIGISKIAQKIGLRDLLEYIKKMGFGEKTGIDLPGEERGIVRTLKDLRPSSILALPMGHQICATLLQMTLAFCSIANGGFLVRPFVVKKIVSPQGQVIKETRPQIIRRVMSPQTSLRMRKILFQVVERGTGRLAKIKGLKIAGKTGTAQKIEDGKYSHRLFRASFIGFYPVENPYIVIGISFDEPIKSHYGGVVAAPVFKRILLRIKDYLDLKFRNLQFVKDESK